MSYRYPPPLLLLLLLPLPLLLLLAAPARSAAAGAADAAASGDVAVSAWLPGGAARTGVALGELAALVLRAAGLSARAAPPPPACAVDADGRACAAAAERALAAGALLAALVPVEAARAPAAWRLRDAGLDELGDAAPPARRACWALEAAGAAGARSLLELSGAVAAHYGVAHAQLAAAAAAAGSAQAVEEAEADAQAEAEARGGPCRARDERACATLLTSSAGEARVLRAAAAAHRLRARVLPLGPRLPALLPALADRLRALNASVVACDWALDAPDPDEGRARPLGPPPCFSDDCPFESRRLVKLARATALARSPAALRALLRLELDSRELAELARLARDAEPAAAARAFLAAHPALAAPRGPREVRVAVLLPAAGARREAYDGAALAAAAAAAEEELEERGVPRGARLAVEVYDDRCDAARAYKYLLDALGTGAYGALSAVAGPACGAAFADVARQGPAHALPVLAYTPQAVAAARTGGARALLAAGDARESSAALGAWLASMRWRRLAVLSEPATHAALDASLLHAALVHQLELPDGEAADRDRAIVQWAHRVAAARGRIVYLCLEDARAVRAALCAGRAAGLTAAAGAVWILPAALPPAWARPGATDAHACTRAQLEEAAAGHFALGPEWLARWDGPDGDAAPGAPDEWIARWRTQCRRAGGAACAWPGPHAALLYDTLRLWATALDRLLADRPAALDDLHDAAVVRALVTHAATGEFRGVTGAFEWSPLDAEGGAYARRAALVVWQREAGARRAVARWERGALRALSAPRWHTAGGGAPDDGDDGADACALRPLARLLRASCGAAYAALGALALAVCAGALAAAALLCRRRAEREYRAKLEALGLRALAAAPAGLDRWEIGRERVVINRKLGMGAFGTVYGGHALLSEGRAWTAVAVKTLKAGATVDEKLDFLSEAEAMKRFDHGNVVRLLAVVTKTEPVCTVMEFMLYGDLKNYLLARRHLAGGAGAEEREQVSAARLTGMALGAARALAYLARLRYVHRDVAARNCLVSSRGVLKLADFGMTRLVFENDYYRFSRKGMLPVRWMAPESLALGVFSAASDVWSFGVLLYEIVTFGALPFQGLSNAEVLARVKAGDTLDPPPGIEPRLEELMARCWRRERAARPTAAQLADALAAAPRLLAPCLDVPLDALPLEARWASRASWGAPASAATDTTYLSDAPRDCDRFLP